MRYSISHSVSNKWDKKTIKIMNYVRFWSLCALLKLKLTLCYVRRHKLNVQCMRVCFIEYHTNIRVQLTGVLWSLCCSRCVLLQFNQRIALQHISQWRGSSSAMSQWAPLFVRSCWRAGCIQLSNTCRTCGLALHACLCVRVCIHILYTCVFVWSWCQIHRGTAWFCS